MSISHAQGDLAPCPFCKRPVWAVEREGQSEYVLCCKCKARGPMVRAFEYRTESDEDGPEDCWNRSHPTGVGPMTREEILAALRDLNDVPPDHKLHVLGQPVEDVDDATLASVLASARRAKVQRDRVVEYGNQVIADMEAHLKELAP